VAGQRRYQLVGNCVEQQAGIARWFLPKEVTDGGDVEWW
jgi:hypothetical protein